MSYLDDISYRVVKDGYNTSFPVRKTLQFSGCVCVDDPSNDKTIIYLDGETPVAGNTLAMVLAGGNDAIGYRIVNLGTPQYSGDAANKAYVDLKVLGPVSATDSAIALFDATTGKKIKNSLVTIDGSGNISTPGLVDGYNLAAKFQEIINSIVTDHGALTGLLDDDHPQYAKKTDLDGYVTGPASATNNGIALFDNTTGKLIKNSLVTIDSSGNIATPGTVDGYNLSDKFEEIDNRIVTDHGSLTGLEDNDHPQYALNADGYNIELSYVPTNYAAPSSSIIGQHIAQIDYRLGNIVAGGIILSAGTNTKNSGTVAFADSNGVSFGMDTAGVITASVSVASGGMALSAGTNSKNSGTVSFVNSNGLSWGMDTAGAITGSVSVAAGGVAISAGSNSKNSGTVVFASASNNVSCGMDTAGVVTWSVGSVAQTTIGISAGSNSRNSGTVVFASNSNGISCGMDTAGSITWSTTQPTQMTIGVGTTTVSGNSVVFSNSNGVSFGMATGTGGGTITASVAAAEQAPLATFISLPLVSSTYYYSIANNQVTAAWAARKLTLIPFVVTNNCSISEYREYVSFSLSNNFTMSQSVNTSVGYAEDIALYSWNTSAETWGLCASTNYLITLSKNVTTNSSNSSGTLTLRRYASATIGFNGYTKSTSISGAATNGVGITAAFTNGNAQVVVPFSTTLTPGVYGLGRYANYFKDHTNAGYNLDIYITRTVGTTSVVSRTVLNPLTYIPEYNNSTIATVPFGNPLESVSYFAALTDNIWSSIYSGTILPAPVSIANIGSATTNLTNVDIPAFYLK
jgi:hypothetical protein